MFEMNDPSVLEVPDEFIHSKQFPSYSPHFDRSHATGSKHASSKSSTRIKAHTELLTNYMFYIDYDSDDFYAYAAHLKELCSGGSGGIVNYERNDVNFVLS